MSNNFLDREQKRVHQLILKGDITFEQAEIILTALILERMQQGKISPNEASDMLQRIH
ncbi:MAG: hypothetical protein WC509_01940 [Candidatus Izemoplasmatales bacterium]